MLDLIKYQDGHYEAVIELADGSVEMRPATKKEIERFEWFEAQPDNGPDWMPVFGNISKRLKIQTGGFSCLSVPS